MLARFLLHREINGNENHSSKPHEETKSRVGVHDALRLGSVYAITQPDSIDEIGGPFLQGDWQATVMLGAESQPLGIPVLSAGITGLRNKPGQGCKPIMGPADESVVIEAIQKDRLSVMKAKERWQQATGKEACKSTFRSFLSALAQDLDV